MSDSNRSISGQSKRKMDILLSFGAHKEIDTSLSKMIHFQIAKYRSNIDQIQYDLNRFEKKYNLSTEEFYSEFESGKTGDSADYFEWAGLYENVLLYSGRIRSLEAALNSD